MKQTTPRLNQYLGPSLACLTTMNIDESARQQETTSHTSAFWKRKVMKLSEIMNSVTGREIRSPRLTTWKYPARGCPLRGACESIASSLLGQYMYEKGEA